MSCTLMLIVYYVSTFRHYLTSSKTTLTDYQCVSTGCCTHVAKTEIIIDNQHVTNITAKVMNSPQTTKRKHRKCFIVVAFFLIYVRLGMQ